MPLPPQVPSELFPVPTAQIWLSMARLVNGGSMLPHVSDVAIYAAAGAAILPLLSRILQWRIDSAEAKAMSAGQRPESAAPAARIALTYMPSGVGFAVGMYVSPQFTIPRVLGTIAEQAWLRCNPNNHRDMMIVVASGLVLGEGTAALIWAVVKSIVMAA